MNIEKIGEPIRVLAACSAGRIDPVRFRWGGRTYQVDAINCRWTDRHGEGYCLHYSVQAGGQTYLLHFGSKEVQWWLDETAVE